METKIYKCIYNIKTKKKGRSTEEIFNNLKQDDTELDIALFKETLRKLEEERKICNISTGNKELFVIPQ